MTILLGFQRNDIRGQALRLGKSIRFRWRYEQDEKLDTCPQKYKNCINNAVFLILKREENYEKHRYSEKA